MSDVGMSIIPKVERTNQVDELTPEPNKQRNETRTEHDEKHRIRTLTEDTKGPQLINPFHRQSIDGSIDLSQHGDTELSHGATYTRMHRTAAVVVVLEFRQVCCSAC